MEVDRLRGCKEVNQYTSGEKWDKWSFTAVCVILYSRTTDDKRLALVLQLAHIAFLAYQLWSHPEILPLHL